MTSVPNVPLLIIDYHLLLQKDPAEIEKLFQICTNLGFFYLKLDNQLDPTPIYTLAEQVFELPIDTKMKYAMDGKNGVYFGYKATGTMYVDRKGTPDKVEFWNIAKDEIILEDKTTFPKPIIAAKDTIKEYMIKSHEIVLVILEILSSKLGLTAQILPDLHRITQPSGDQLRLTKSTMYPHANTDTADVALSPHTDFGSITILFNQLGGLQILTSNGEWLDIPPLPGYAIVNLGDSMVKLSDGILKSNIHRVVAISGLNKPINRYSIVYFSRPENNIRMQSLLNIGNHEELDTDVLTVQEWIARRVKNFQVANYKDESTYETSRGTEGPRETNVPM